MANSVFQIKRTSVSGRAANSTTLPNPGELAINMADQIMYSTNGTTIFEIGANNTNLHVTGNATIKAIVANGSLGTADQVLTTNGTVIYWKTPAAGGGGSVNVDAQYSWTNLHFFSNAVNFAAQIANSTGFYPFSNTNGSALGHGGTRWILYANTGYFTGNVGIGTSVSTDTKMQLSSSFNNDFTSWGIYNYAGDNNVAITAARNRYGTQNQLYNFSQNKSADGLTTYLSNYRALQSDVFNGSTSTGGDAFAEELTAGRFTASQYANGVNANGVTTLSGTRNYAFQYGSGVINNAYGSLNVIYAGNNSVTGNISFAVGVYSSITSNVSQTINSGYLFYGDHQGTTTTTKYGIYLTNESNNYMSGSLYVAGAQTAFSSSMHANSTGFYAQANTKEFGSDTRRWNVWAQNGSYSGNVGIGVAATSALSSLHVKTTAPTDTRIILENSGGSNLYIQAEQSVGSFGTTTNHGLNIFTNNAVRMFISAGGNAGIGMLSAIPAYKLQVNGSFAATTKSFVIDHPTKPDMKLRYGSLEGPENGVYVRGCIEYHDTIYLPDYWSELIDADTITVSLTPTKYSQSDYYVETIDSDYITLNKNFTGHYIVFAERKDVPRLEVEF